MKQAPRPDNRGEPIFVVRMGWTRDPIQWGLVGARSLGFVALVVFGGFLSARELCVGIPLSLTVLLFFGKFLVSVFNVDRSTFKFFDDLMVIHRRLPDRGFSNVLERHSYQDVRHIELKSQTEVMLTLARATGDTYDAVMNLPARTSEDVLDLVAEHVHAIIPEHLFSIAEHGKVRHSVESTMEDLFAAWGAGQELMTTEVDIRAPVVRSADRTYRLDWPTLHAMGPPVLRIRGSKVVHHSGIVIGMISLGKSYRSIDIEMFDGETIHVESPDPAVKTDGVVDIEGESVGRIDESSGYTLHFREPVFEFLALTILMAYLSGRRQLRL